MIERMIAKKIIEDFNNREDDGSFLFNGRFNLISLFKNTLKGKGIKESFLVDESIQPEFIDFQTDDNITIKGLVYKNKKSKKWILALHGFSMSKESMTNFAWIYYKMGFNLLVIDFRNHGDSQKATITLGINEQYEIKKALEYLNKNYKVKSIGLVGVSMGAFAINLFALKDFDFAKKSKVKFGITDSSFISITEVLRNMPVLKSLPIKTIPLNLIKECINIYKEDYNVDITKGDCKLYLDVCKKTFPILLIHSKEDKIVPYVDSENLYEMRKTIKGSKKDKLLIFDCGEHVRSFVANDIDYQEACKKFIKQF